MVYSINKSYYIIVVPLTASAEGNENNEREEK